MSVCVLALARADMGDGCSVNEHGPGSAADGKGEEGIDRSFDRAGTPAYLTE